MTDRAEFYDAMIQEMSDVHSADDFARTQIAQKEYPIHDRFERVAKYAQKRSADELYQLIKGLIYFTRIFPSSGGGSVSPISTLLDIFAEKDPEREPELTAWIIDNRTNRYDPWGTSRYSYARSLGERAAELRDQAHARDVNLANESARQGYAALRKANNPGSGQHSPGSDEAIEAYIRDQIFRDL